MVLAADGLEDADKAATEWIKLQVETTKLETDWRAQRALLESLVAALEERAASVEEKRDYTKAKTARDRQEIDGIQSRTQSATDDLKGVETGLKSLSQKLLALRPQLPPQLSDALEMSYRSLAGTTTTPTERMQVAMNVLNRCAQFNRLITVCEDELTLEGEPPAKSYEVIYWGLSYGYAVDRSARKAWLGMPGPNGWRWEAKPDAFDRIVTLIAIANGKADPAFVSVPAVVARLSADPANK